MRVADGEVFQAETEDSAPAGRARPRRPARSTSRPCGPRATTATPATGPVHVAGRRAGRHPCRPHPRHGVRHLGYFGYWPFLYHLQDWLTEPVTGLVDIRDGHVCYTMQTAAGLQARAAPSGAADGRAASARASPLEVPTTATAGRFGSNLDVPEVGPGNTVYLPVAVPGGLLFIGDRHPYQGDGEVSGCEMRALITLSVRVLKGWTRTMAWPRSRRRRTWSPSGAGSPGRESRPVAGHPRDDPVAGGAARLDDGRRRLLALTGDLRPGQMHRCRPHDAADCGQGTPAGLSPLAGGPRGEG